MKLDVRKTHVELNKLRSELAKLEKIVESAEDTAELKLDLSKQKALVATLEKENRNLKAELKTAKSSMDKLLVELGD